jgi:hypothetical protein
MKFVPACISDGAREFSAVKVFVRLAMRGAPVGCYCALAIVVFAGCNRSSQESQVSGRVTLDGDQIGPGTVVFAPLEGGKPATGSIEKDGSYLLNTSREVGLAAGKYKVAISVRELPENVKRSDQPPPGKLRIPGKYEQITTSGLEYEVAPGRNTIDIDLISS